MTNKYNREYREFKPTSLGPPTERICKRIKCEDNSSTPPPPPNPTP